MMQPVSRPCAADSYRAPSGTDRTTRPVPPGVVQIDNVIELIEHHSEVAAGLLARPYRIGFSTFSKRDYDKEKARYCFRGFFQALSSRIPLSQVAVVAAANETVLREVLGEFPEIQIIPIGCKRALRPEYHGTLLPGAILTGSKWEAAAPLAVEVANCWVTVGGSKYAEQETREYFRKDPDGTFLLRGYPEHRADGTFAPSTSDSLECGVIIPSGDVARQSADLAARVSDHLLEQNDARQDSLLARLVMTALPDSALDDGGSLSEWAQSNAAGSQLLQLLKAVQWELLHHDIAEEEVSAAVVELGNRLIAATGLRSPHDIGPEEWKTRVLTLIDGELERRFPALPAGWGRKSFERDVEFPKRAPQPLIEQRDSAFDLQCGRRTLESFQVADPSEYPFAPSQYAALRLGGINCSYLRRAFERHHPVEVFLGSEARLRDYYGGQGFEHFVPLQSSAGTDFFQVTNPRTGASRVLITGVHCEARLEQLGSLLKAAGFPACAELTIRGDMTELRETNREVLSRELARGRREYAAAVIGNDLEARLEITRHFRDLGCSVRSFPKRVVGPFRFTETEVVFPSGEREYYLTFSPCYGEGSYDLVTALHSAGVNKLCLGGCSGSLDAHERLGTVHRIVETASGGIRITGDDLEACNIDVARIPGSREARNVTTQTPLTGTASFREAQAADGVNDLDQETAWVFRALRDCQEADAREGRRYPLFFQSSTIVTDTGEQLVRGTTSAEYAAAVAGAVRNFLKTSAEWQSALDESAAALSQRAILRNLLAQELKNPTCDSTRLLAILGLFPAPPASVYGRREARDAEGCKTLADLYRLPARVFEGYSVGDHTERMINQGTRYCPLDAIPGPFRRETLLLARALHDIGKGLGAKASDQYAFTLPVVEWLYEEGYLPLDRQQFRLLKAIIDNNDIGDLARAGATELPAFPVKRALKHRIDQGVPVSLNEVRARLANRSVYRPLSPHDSAVTKTAGLFVRRGLDLGVEPLDLFEAQLRAIYLPDVAAYTVDSVNGRSVRGYPSLEGVLGMRDSAVLGDREGIFLKDAAIGRVRCAAGLEESLEAVRTVLSGTALSVTVPAERATASLRAETAAVQ